MKHLLKQYKGHSIYFLDEPTVGLHPSDIEKLLLVLKSFLDRGDTILMIEHDMSLISAVADDVIVLDGGQVLAQVRVGAGFKLNRSSATRWAETDFARPAGS